ncbi:MAG: hypothetical protein R3C11_00435 [Planctomycetaceae bacterium]
MRFAALEDFDIEALEELPERMQEKEKPVKNGRHKNGTNGVNRIRSAFIDASRS